jgi:hypothetical protein
MAATSRALTTSVSTLARLNPSRSIIGPLATDERTAPVVMAIARRPVLAALPVVSRMNQGQRQGRH